MKPDGIHFEPGKFMPGVPYRFYLDLDLSEPEIDRFKKELENGWYMKAIAETLFDKPIKRPPGNINYNIHNYCARCKIKYPKGTYRCKNCSNKVRTKPWASNYNRKKKEKQNENVLR